MANKKEPTLYELDASASAVLDIIADNNPYGVMAELRKLGYNPTNIDDAKYRYLQLFLLNSDEFWNSIKNIPFDYRRSTPETEMRIKQLTEALGGEKVQSQARREGASRSGEKKWWEQGLEILLGHQVKGGGVTEEQIVIPTGAYIAFAAIALVLFGIIWLITKMK